MRTLLLLFAWLLVQTAVSQRRSHSVVTEREIKKRTVDVQGTYTINVTPDVAFVSLQLETLDAKSASTAYAIHNKVINTAQQVVAWTKVLKSLAAACLRCPYIPPKVRN